MPRRGAGLLPRFGAALLAMLPALAIGTAEAGQAGPGAGAGAPEIVPFAVAVTLSPRAAARLAALGESITVAAYYSGEPTRAARRHADRMGQINLGAERADLPGAGGTARLTGRNIRLAEIAWVENRAVQVLVNVFSARRRNPDNLLDCGIHEGALAEAAARSPIPIACRLIGER
ncbi:hypothetical protein M0638_04475 [Roseomonas sp. NAR14]|uniref:Uncharacterized protein n=1 Tax=Roseomonas acroporae TaxID=2937791 RepID=A0A9X1Y525_9PROT|nr:hypothetical protein [Roseomonas acroporae]MCK8783636.1 hypothetical protein [Roseomonas acroporae]